MKFECETEACLTIADQKVSVVVFTKTHNFNDTDPITGKKICSNCGVKYNAPVTP